MSHCAEVSSLTGEPTPAGDVAGSAVGQHDTLVREAGGRDCVREGNRGRQLDQGNVVPAKGKSVHPHLGGDDKHSVVSAALMF